MVKSPTGFEHKNDHWRGQQQLSMTDQSSFQRGRTASSNPQLSDNNENIILGPRRTLIPQQICLEFDRRATFLEFPQYLRKDVQFPFLAQLLRIKKY
jgi:hypothetical protein